MNEPERVPTFHTRFRGWDAALVAAAVALALAVAGGYFGSPRAGQVLVALACLTCYRLGRRTRVYYADDEPAGAEPANAR